MVNFTIGKTTFFISESVIIIRPPLSKAKLIHIAVARRYRALKTVTASQEYLPLASLAIGKHFNYTFSTATQAYK